MARADTGDTKMDTTKLIELLGEEKAKAKTDEKVGFGKYSDKTFREVLSEDKEYLKWLTNCNDSKAAVSASITWVLFS